MNIDQLKELANHLGFSYHHNVGEAKLKEQLETFCIENNTTLEEEMNTFLHLQTNNNNESVKNVKANVDEKEIERLRNISFATIDTKKRQNSKSDAMKLVRCIITCNDPNKRNYVGDIFTARNAVVTEVKKFIPFGVPTHVPQILLNVIKEQPLQVFISKKNQYGGEYKESKLISKFNIQELPPLTPAELDAIRRKQLAEGSIEESM